MHTCSGESDIVVCFCLFIIDSFHTRDTCDFIDNARPITISTFYHKTGLVPKDASIWAKWVSGLETHMDGFTAILHYQYLVSSFLFAIDGFAEVPLQGPTWRYWTGYCGFYPIVQILVIAPILFGPLSSHDRLSVLEQ